MRIISGTARGKQLRTFKTSSIRPTSDRVREAVFSILTSKLGSFEDIRVLDICAGTGALGLEALSRGAECSVFIDSSRQAVELIKHNCGICALEQAADIIRGGYSTSLPRLKGAAFELIFIDPPYNKDMLPEIINTICNLNLLASGGIICAEESKKARIASDIGCCTCIDTRTYGDTRIYLFSTEAV